MRHNLINFLISCFNMSNDVLNARHFLGQLLISISSSVSLSSVTLAKSVFLGKTLEINLTIYIRATLLCCIVIGKIYEYSELDFNLFIARKFLTTVNCKGFK